MNPTTPLLYALLLVPIGSGPMMQPMAESMVKSMVEEIPVFELSAPLGEVTVYPEGARCEHPGRLDLPAGDSRVRMVLIDELPAGEALEEVADYHFTTEGCTLLQSSVDLVTIPPDADASREHERRLDEQARRVRTAEDAVESARSSLELLDSMGRTLSEQVDLSDPEAVRTLHSFLAEQREDAVLTLSERERTLASETRLRSELEDAVARLHRGTRQLHAELLVNTENAGPVDLLATSFVEAAGWVPQVRISRSNAGDDARVELLAEITNDTDHDWDSVALRLSTERTRSFDPPEEVALAGIDKASDEDGEASPPEGDQEAAPYTPLQAVHRTAQRTTIEHGRSQSVLLERFRTACELRHHARPTVDDACHILSTLRNETPRLISAAPVTLFIDGRMVGRTRIDDVAPGDAFTISWGTRPNLRITRELVDRSTKRIGLLGGGRLTTLRYRISIRNLEPEPVELILEDRLPTALNREITVEGSEFTPAVTALEGPSGSRLVWALSIPSGGPDAAARTVEWTVEVTHSADLDTTPIPE